VKPVALRMVWQVYNAVKIPVIGMGGIMTATDAIEFMIAGASAIQVGTALFIDPTIPVQIIDGISNYMERHKIQSVNELIGSLQC
jgi:dihydroorotate dehydrogenase (NAD+) catalytic subunit